jgi:threonyl-tRNA synthetase
MPVVTLPDGSQRDFAQPVTVAEVAQSIGAGLARAALAGKVDGRLVDTSFVISSDAQLDIVTEKDPEGLEIIRHSTAHLMAYAVKELFPTAQVTIGPVIENGFYYDFAFERPFTLDDLAAIERRMANWRGVTCRCSGKSGQRDQADRLLQVDWRALQGGTDRRHTGGSGSLALSRGRLRRPLSWPARPSTGKLKVFKLMKLAGAYWRGDHRNEQLQRIYGTAWTRKEDQDAYLHMLEEAEKRDHRKLGRQLDLFHLQDEAPGMVFWHPKGWTIWQEVEQYMRRVFSVRTATAK